MGLCRLLADPKSPPLYYFVISILDDWPIYTNFEGGARDEKT